VVWITQVYGAQWVWIHYCERHREKYGEPFSAGCRSDVASLSQKASPRLHASQKTVPTVVRCAV